MVRICGKMSFFDVLKSLTSHAPHRSNPAYLHIWN